MQANGDGRAFTGRAADCDGSPVLLDDFLDAGEAQSGSRALSGEKGLEDLVDDFCRDGDSIILNKNLNLEPSSGTMLGDLDMKMAAGRHGFARIPEDA